MVNKNTILNINKMLIFLQGFTMALESIQICLLARWNQTAQDPVWQQRLPVDDVNKGLSVCIHVYADGNDSRGQLYSG